MAVEMQRLFVLALTLLFGAGTIVPNLNKKWARAVEVSLLLSLTGSLLAAAVGGAIWFGVLKPAPEALVILTSSWLLPRSDLPSLEGIPALQWQVHIDLLSAFFLFLVAAFSALVAIYAFEALKAPHYRNQRAGIVSAFNLFVWAVVIVILAYDVFSLILGLEVMTLAFAYLTLYKHMFGQDQTGPLPADEEQKKNARLAPQVYLIMSHTSTAFLLIAFLLLAVHAGGLSFDVLIDKAWSLSPPLGTAAFLLALAGAGIRAGLTPAHFWTPLVHPSPPSLTYALTINMSIKIGVYLMLRFFFQFLEPQAWWGYLVLTVAATTAVVNAWYAIASHDLKTALAYHSIENMGIITIGIGLALVFASQETALAGLITALALVACLYHTLNHAVFKGLLYLATAAIDNLTHGVVEFYKLGGLIKLYPVTAGAFLVGAVAISGFPPLNGFVSEWLTLQALFRGAEALKGTTPSFGILVLLASLLLLAAAFALTAYCFYKIAGLTLLGQPRSSRAERERWERGDVPGAMQGVMLLVALLCLVLGLLPGQVVPLFSNTIQSLVLVEPLASPIWVGLEIHTPEAPWSSTLGMIPVVVVAALLGLVPVFAIPFFLGRSVERPFQAWNCGTPFVPTTMQYTGAALSELIRRLLYFVPRKLEEPPYDYLPARLKLSNSEENPQIVVELFRAAYNRCIHWLLASSEFLGKTLQNRDIRRYLGYILLANIAALALFLLLGG